MLILLLGAAALAAAVVTEPQLRPQEAVALPLRTSTVDPCSVASAQQLKGVISAGLEPYFPLKRSDDGEHVTISDPEITDASCPSFRITVRTKIRYQKTRGLPQGSTSGDMRFRSPLHVAIRHPMLIKAGTALTAEQVHGARACLTDINVVALNLNNVPNWLDSGWIAEKVLDPKLNSACFDVTSLVRAYIESGGTVKAG